MFNTFEFNRGLFNQPPVTVTLKVTVSDRLKYEAATSDRAGNAVVLVVSDGLQYVTSVSDSAKGATLLTVSDFSKRTVSVKDELKLP